MTGAPWGELQRVFDDAVRPLDLMLSDVEQASVVAVQTPGFAAGGMPGPLRPHNVYTVKLDIVFLAARSQGTWVMLGMGNISDPRRP